MTGAGTTTVVAAAVVRRGRVLAARRTTPPAAAGRWELPGGKVEPGERPADALEREVAEELGCTVEVTGWLVGVVPIGDGLELRAATVRLVAGEPTAGEHDRLRWLAADELDDVDWLEPDRPFLPELAAVLRGEVAEVLRAVLFDEDAARAVAARLVADGYDAQVVRERLAGEDDDEDHPWAVLTDAPEAAVELLVDDHDGWLDREHGAADAGWAPTEASLPTEPRRTHRP